MISERHLLVFFVQPVPTTVYRAVCLKCQQPSQDSSRCLSCGSGEALVGPQAAPRPPIRTSPGPHGLQQNFYKPGAALREPLPVRVTGSRAAPLPPSNGRIPLLAGTSGCCRAAPPSKGRRTAAGQQPELNDPSEWREGSGREGPGSPAGWPALSFLRSRPVQRRWGRRSRDGQHRKREPTGQRLPSTRRLRPLLPGALRGQSGGGGEERRGAGGAERRLLRRRQHQDRDPAEGPDEGSGENAGILAGRSWELNWGWNLLSSSIPVWESASCRAAHSEEEEA